MSSLLLCVAALSAIPLPGVLTGRITDTDGQAIAGARVDVWTAKPKIGPGSL